MFLLSLFTFYIMVITNADTTIKIPSKKIPDLINDNKASAKAVNLRYVSDSDKGIERIRSREKFEYRYDDKKVTDAETLDRIKKLVIPPA